MMTPTFRALAPYGKTPEQVRLDRAAEAGKAAADTSFEAVLSTQPPVALAQPEPVVPTDLDAEFRSWYVNRYGRPYFGGIALVECVEWTQFVLARWGTPAINPVPVSEPLPGAKDCDAEGRCWLTHVDVEPGWVLDSPEQCTNWTHWLPHWALPIPC